MGIILTIIIILFLFWLLRKPNDKNDVQCEISITVSTNEEDYKKYLKKREKAVKKMMNSFKPLTDWNELSNLIETAIEDIAEAHHLKIPSIVLDKEEFNNIKQKEISYRKALNEAYKNRHIDSKEYIKAIVLAYKHLKILLEDDKGNFKVLTGAKRLVTVLGNPIHREICLNLLYFLSDRYKKLDDEKAYNYFSEGIERQFRDLFDDIEEQKNYEFCLQKYEKNRSIENKQSILENIIEYNYKRAKLSVQYQERAIAFAKEQANSASYIVREQYEFTGLTKLDEIFKSEYYYPPYLLSIDVLYSLGKMLCDNSLIKLALDTAKSIKSDYFEDINMSELDDRFKNEKNVLEDFINNHTKTISAKPSGLKNKQKFLNRDNKPASTEEIAVEHYIEKGYKVIRTEVSFWQALFGLFFWEEIFSGTDLPNKYNDIPQDLFSGDSFYLKRKELFEKKYELLKTNNLSDYLKKQVKKYNSKYTRLIADMDRQNSYYKFLASNEVLEFLQHNQSQTLEIIYRIAHNLNDNRSGLPDYMVLKEGNITHIEVKGIREKIRNSQMSWMQWFMDKQYNNIKIVRVKSV